MAQAKKKTATKTKKAGAQRKTGSRANTRTQKKQISNQERMHIYITTAMAIIAGVLLCANAAMMIV